MKTLVKKIEDVSARVQYLSSVEATGKSPELLAQLKILNGLVRTLVQVVGDPDKDRFVCERDDCAIHSKLKEFETIHYHIYHHMLFGPLARIIGLLGLVQMEIVGGRFEKINALRGDLESEIEQLKQQITTILEAKNGPSNY